MANRVTADDVKIIITTSMTDEQIDVFITAANLTVTDILSGANLSDAQLKEIERWLSAHLIAIKEPGLSDQKIGWAEETKARGVYGKMLEFTEYGQQVIVLDTSGKMANAGKRVSKIEVAYDSSNDDWR